MAEKKGNCKTNQNNCVMREISRLARHRPYKLRMGNECEYENIKRIIFLETGKKREKQDEKKKQNIK